MVTEPPVLIARIDTAADAKVPEGVPEITPVAPFKETPGGKVPAVMAYDTTAPPVLDGWAPVSATPTKSV